MLNFYAKNLLSFKYFQKCIQQSLTLCKYVVIILNRKDYTEQNNVEQKQKIIRPN